MAEFRMCLSQQVQILQSEYPVRILPEHEEEMKQDHFYEGLNSKYQQKLAHKVDGKTLAGYSDLLLAMRKLESRTEAMELLSQKTTVTSVLNMIHSQTSVNLFSSCKLKGNCTLTARAANISSNEVDGKLWYKAGRRWANSIFS